jgi:cysteinyl-tRNA synthetase
MALYVHNTASRKKELFEPGDPSRVTMYVCGPTVYNFVHIGNGRPYVVFDVLARLLRRSYDLVYARNLTDVDDKINAAATEEGVEIGVLTARYIEAFHADMAALRVRPPDVEPRVTEHIRPIVAFIRRLIERGHAYEADGHVLFAVSSFPEYGKLSRRSLDDMIAGARVEVAPYKREPADFVLWKPSDAGVIGWDSPWGRGRPGWHIECSAMAEAHLGETIDIHGGGQDLVFPHHENETAQSTCVHAGATFARYWMHNGLVNMGSEKMSKSTGNLLRLRDLLREHDGEVLRLCLLTAHYRQPLEWTPQLPDEAAQKLDRFYGVLRDAGLDGPSGDSAAEAPPAAVVAALEDDLNTPLALTELSAIARAANKAHRSGEKVALARALRAGAGLLGLLERAPKAWFAGDAAAGTAAVGPDEAEIDALVERREPLRKARRFAEADGIRDQLARAGVVIEDGAGGTRWRRSR